MDLIGRDQNVLIAIHDIVGIDVNVAMVLIEGKVSEQAASGGHINGSGEGAQEGRTAGGSVVVGVRGTSVRSIDTAIEVALAVDNAEDAGAGIATGWDLRVRSHESDSKGPIQ